MLRSFGYIFAAALLAATLSAQTPAGLQCSALTGVPATLRLAGQAELVGDVVLTCTQLPVPVPSNSTFDVRVALPVRITSPIIDSTYRTPDALLLVDEPGSPTTPIHPCDRFGVPLTPGAACNAFPGEFSGPYTLVFHNVPLAPAGPQPRIIRLTNLRIAAADLPPSPSPMLPTPANVFLSASGAYPVAISNPTLTVAYGIESTNFALLDPATSAPLPSPLSFPVAAGRNPAIAANPTAAPGEIASFVLHLGNTSPGNFKPRVRGDRWTDADTLVASPLAQNVPGQVFNTESGFFDPSLPAPFARAGLASQATRFYLRLTQVPAGLKVFAGNYMFGSSSLNSPIRRIAAETGPALPSPATNSALLPYAPMTEVQPGVLEAIYEVTTFAPMFGLPAVDLPLLVAYPAGSVAPAQVYFESGFAPRLPDAGPDSLVVPRFKSTSRPLPLFSLDSSNPGLIRVDAALSMSMSVPPSFPIPFQVSGPAACSPGSYTTPRLFDWAPGTTCTLSFAPEVPFSATQKIVLDPSAGASAVVTATTSPQVITKPYNSEVFLVRGEVAPAGCGSITLNGAGTQAWIPNGQSVTLSATATVACSFQSFSSSSLFASGSVTTNPASVPVIMGAATFVANFAQGVPRLTLASSSKSSAGTTRTYTLMLKNSGAATALNPRVSAASIAQLSGPACTPTLTTPLPVAGPASLAPGASAPFALTVNFTTCSALPAAIPFRLALTASATNAADQQLALTVLR